jgi:hypothetical protein
MLELLASSIDLELGFCHLFPSRSNLHRKIGIGEE